MYTAYLNGVKLYDPKILSDEAMLIDPVLTLEEGAAGSFEFTIPPTNKLYSQVTRLSSVITVKDNDEVIWEGRPISDSLDFWNNRKVYCEGALAYLNDTIQPLAEYTTTLDDFFATLFGYHNGYAPNKLFYIGQIDFTGTGYFVTNYNTTLECIKEQLLDVLGGHIRIRYGNGVKYFDYLADYITNPTPGYTIEFGENLIDFVRNWDASEFATVILPLGASLETTPVEGITDYLTVSDVNHGSPYVVNQTAVDAYGWVAKVVRFDDVDDPNELLALAQQYLSTKQFDAMTIEITAADLHLIDPNKPPFRLLDYVACISRPHGMNLILPITKIELHLDAPESTVYTLGAKLVQPLTAQFRRL